MPPSLREWLPEGHLAWCVLDAVAVMDLSAFYARYRADGWGRPAYEPAMMVALILYAYAKGERSSRGIERECLEDVAYRVICANTAPDHVTINRFRAEHRDALAADWGGVRALEGHVTLAADTRFASEIVAQAVSVDDAAVPAANVIAFDAAR